MENVWPAFEFEVNEKRREQWIISDRNIRIVKHSRCRTAAQRNAATDEKIGLDSGDGEDKGGEEEKRCELKLRDNLIYNTNLIIILL